MEELIDPIEKYRGRATGWIVMSLNNKNYKNIPLDEWDVAIDILKSRQYDVSRWRDTEDEEHQHQLLVDRAETVIYQIMDENDQYKLGRLNMVVGNSDVADLPSDDLEEILRIANELPPEPNKRLLKQQSRAEKWKSKYPKKEKKAKEAKPKKKTGRPCGSKNSMSYSTFRKARDIITLLEQGETMAKIAKKGIASPSYIQRVKLRWEAEKAGITKRYLESYYIPKTE